MKKKGLTLGILSIGILCLATSLNSRRGSQLQTRQNYCKILDTLVWERYYKTDTPNFCGLQLYYVPILEKKTQIIAHYDLIGFSGVGYRSDSIFNNDIRKWAKSLGCNVKIPPARYIDDTTTFRLDN